MTYRLLITGSRTWRDTAAVRDAILTVRGRVHGPLTIVHGACPCARCRRNPCECGRPVGADAIADVVARELAHLDITIDAYPADWDHCADTCPPRPHRRARRNDVFHPGQSATYCPVAGHRRNQTMVDDGADETHAFPLPCTAPGCPQVGRHDSHGTAHCGRAAWRAGIPVVWHRPGRPVQEVLTP